MYLSFIDLRIFNNLEYDNRLKSFSKYSSCHVIFKTFIESDFV